MSKYDDSIKPRAFGGSSSSTVTKKTLIKLPPVYAVDERQGNNSIQHIIEPGYVIEAQLAGYKSPQVSGQLILSHDGGTEILVVEKPVSSSDGFSFVIQAKRTTSLAGEETDLSSAKWLKHSKLNKDIVSHELRLKQVLDSWDDSFRYVAENPAKGRKGLRAPQLAALHAIHKHWWESREAATIVMPTGTGKTETMLAAIVSVACQRVLVVVPTDALRSQIANKFLTLGILKDKSCHVLSETALRPIVGTLRQMPKTVAEVDGLFERCHVIVTTAQIAGQCSEPVQKRMAHHCPYLFIDEAHHTPAPRWAAFKNKFAAQRILQFTATPFREDGEAIEGKHIYKYPLKRAQEDGYFKPIQFKPVLQFDPTKADRAIAAQAVAQLREDLAQGYNHILMARASRVERAKEVLACYAEYAEFHPILIHSKLLQKEQERLRQQLLSGQSKIVVCVDMFGEGFDLPELKIAAFHNIRQSLAVTLQLAGRFTRSRADLGQATFIANTADPQVCDKLRQLYTSDPDWNVLLPELSEEAIQEQVELREFLEGFANFPPDIPLKNIHPAMSTVIYRTKCSHWTPESFRKGITGISACERVEFDISHERNTLVVVLAHKLPVEWINLKELYNWDWELIIVHWDRAQKLLFIHGSHNDGVYRQLAKVVAGDDVELISEQNLFRCFAGIHRIRLQQVGLKEQFGRMVSYTGRMGAYVNAGLTDVQKRNTQKAVLFGVGYEHGRKVSIGVSRKGRLWSHATANLASLTKWCREVGKKVLDETIDPDAILRGTLESEIVTRRPQKIPFSVDWPECIYQECESAYSFVLSDQTEIKLYEAEITLRDYAEEGPLTFDISSAEASIEVTLELLQQGDQMDYRFRVAGNQTVNVKRRSKVMPLSDFFYLHPPTIWFVDGSSLEGNRYTPLKMVYPPYDRQKIQTWDWTGVNLTKESQGITKEPDSIQFRVVEELKKRDYDIIFDDDDKCEAADVVTIRLADDDNGTKLIEVELYHCKYTKARPGKRSKDLFEVCAQAQKCIHWMESHEKQVDLFTHLLRREQMRTDRQQTSRLERGTTEALVTFREMSHRYPMQVKVFIVQPGLSQKNATRDQLELLSVTENHLLETYNLPFGMIASL